MKQAGASNFRIWSEYANKKIVQLILKNVEDCQQITDISSSETRRGFLI